MLSGSFSLHSLDYSTLKNTYRFTDYNILQLHRQKTAWNKTTNIVKWEKHTSISYGQDTHLYSFFKPFQCHWHTGAFSCFCPMSPKSDRNVTAIPKEHLPLSVWFSPLCITKNKPVFVLQYPRKKDQCWRLLHLWKNPTLKKLRNSSVSQ